MAILYVFTIKDPNNVGAFPPTVTASEWFKKIGKFHIDNSFAVPQQTGANIIFNSISDLNNYFNEYKLTDPDLIADINLWKSAHGVSYHFQYFMLESAVDINPTPIC